ncbi:MAG: hypothetical protein P4L40_09875 [Terracidiphilus sp.]|nr:hypothetical protein [Terracidiphilus sp.]
MDDEPTAAAVAAAADGPAAAGDAETAAGFLDEQETRAKVNNAAVTIAKHTFVILFIAISSGISIVGAGLTS